MAKRGSSSARRSNGSLGTFAGVFTPSVLTILGIILFLRLGSARGALKDAEKAEKGAAAVRDRSNPEATDEEVRIAEKRAREARVAADRAQAKATEAQSQSDAAAPGAKPKKDD
jgi:hypothetical protein